MNDNIVMNDNKPDFFIETFWLDFKKSMINFYEYYNIKRPINIWSDKLNLLQKSESYDKIEKNIRDFISLYAIDVMRKRQVYHMGILITNIKRWNKLSIKYNFCNDEKIKYFNIIFLLIDLFDNINTFTDDIKNEIFDQIELFILYNDLTIIIKYAIQYKKANILDKIRAFTDLNKIIKENYNIDLPENISGRKMLKYFEN